MLRITFVLAWLALLGTATQATAAGTKSVILIIGDGNGLAAQQLYRIMNGPLAVDGMDDSAIVLTPSDSDVVTDSAAAASAMATGQKTPNRHLGMDAQGKPLVSIAERAKKAGKRVGIITTSFLWDATPGAFYAKVSDRDDLDTVTRQALEARLDLLMGGGEANLLPAGRKDGRNLVEEFQKSGSNVATSLATVTLPYLGVFAHEALYSEDPPRYAPPVSLPAMLTSALDALGKKPFFLVVEDEGIDEMAHANSLDQLRLALAHWNLTVAKALEYRRKHPDVAVIVTSDHETGNVAIVAEKECKGRTRLEAHGKAFCVSFHSQGHGGEPVAVYTEGVEIKRAVVENTEIYNMVRVGLGLK